MPRPTTSKQKRIRIDPAIDILVKALAQLSGMTYQQAMEAALLYGVAYINQKNKLELMKWIGRIELPTIQDVQKIMDN